MNARFRVALLLVLGAASTAAAQETVDLAVVHRIKAEAFQGGKVMDHLFFLTDVGGPRLTASPGQRAAADWAIARLKSWGIDSARSEPWGRFGRSWQLKRFDAHQLTPTYAPLHGVPLAWSGGTRGPVTADVVLAPVFERFEDSLRADPARVAARVQEYAKQKRGTLAGRIVLIEPLRELPPATAPALSRFDDADLAKLAAAPEPEPLPPLEWPVTKLPDDPKERQRLLSTLPLEAADDYWTRQTRAWDPLWTFLREEGVPAVLVNDAYGRDAGGTLFAEQAGFWRAGSPVPPPVVVLAAESYGRIARLAQQRHPVRLELEVAVEMQEEDRDAANVVAEIPGGARADEVVMLGAHLDSWHSGTGATDNAAGCAVILEAMRILKALELPLARTVRLALWTGEEQGIYGSRAYVKRHFADPVTMRREPEHDKLAAYFNVDNGTGKIRGVYLQGNDMVRPIFESWLAPFADLGARTLTIRDTDGTDHLPFDAVGLPGFQFIQDPVDYSTRTHHSELDVYDHIQSADLMQASAIVASFVYNAANRPDKLPRKPLPKPLPPRTDAAAR
ncbi:MAG TPA: M20/M25/M40 family metallo-hydrolase [Vicinamibacteria bacterium]